MNPNFEAGLRCYGCSLALKSTLLVTICVSDQLEIIAKWDGCQDGKTIAILVFESHEWEGF